MALPAPSARLKTITAGWAYSSGAKHRAYDYAMPIGTPIYAVQSGVIVGCNDGVPNQPIGRPAGSGAPSNWIQLVCKHPKTGETITVYYQHLNRGLKVVKGQKVAAGQLIGYSGNSGNTTGPHLHLAVGKGNDAGKRYEYLNDGQAVWTPAEVYPNPTATLTRIAPRPVYKQSGSYVKTYQYHLRGFVARYRGWAKVAQLNPTGATSHYGWETRRLQAEAHGILATLTGNAGWKNLTTERPGDSLLARIGLVVR